LLARGIEEETMAEVSQSNTGSNVDVVKPLTFNRNISKVLDFLIVCRLYIRIRMRDKLVEEQIQCVFSYVQEGLAIV